MECAVAGSGAEVLYDIIWGSLVDPDLSGSADPPLPKRQRQAALVTVASLTVQEHKAITPKPVGGASVSREEIPAEMEPLRISVGDTRWVCHCHVEGCTEGHWTLWAAICSHLCQAHFGTKLLCAPCSWIFFNTDALQLHGKQAHPSGSSDSKVYFIILPLLSHQIPMSS